MIQVTQSKLGSVRQKVVRAWEGVFFGSVMYYVLIFMRG